jgi:hypothetical protein
VREGGQPGGPGVLRGGLGELDAAADLALARVEVAGRRRDNARMSGTPAMLSGSTGCGISVSKRSNNAPARS